MKKIFLLICIIIFGLLIASCNDTPVDPTPTPEPDPIVDPVVDPVDESVEEVINLINSINSPVIIDDELVINNCIEKYNALSEEQKEKVTNYNVLENAQVEFKDLVIDILKEKANTYLIEEFPSKAEISSSAIDFERTLRVEVGSKKYSIGFEITSSNTYIIDDTLHVSHTSANTTVSLNICVYCLEVGLKEFCTKEVEVEGYTLKDIKGKKIVAGYFYGNTTLSDLDKETLDVIKYSFGAVCLSNGTYSIQIDNESALKELTNAHNDGIRVTLALGGWHDDSSAWEPYKAMIRTEKSRIKAADAIVACMVKYSLDGIDMDWEYPSSSDKTNFGLFMQVLKAKMLEANPNAILSIAVGCGTSTGNYYDYSVLKDCVDYFDVMCYDFTYTGYNTMVHLCNLSSGKYTSSSAKVGMEYLAKQGIDKSKIILGCAFYGHVMSGIGSTNNGLGQDYTNRTYTSFTNIKTNYLDKLSDTCKRYFDSEAQAYYIYDSVNNILITYDDPDAIKLKCNYVIENGYGGIMYWSHSDDSTGTLMGAINKYLKK